ncbi:MAG: amidohydrolase [Bacteroidia bacterium]|nr:amidohydrolase [Bacteroidia bacterium]
MKVTLIQTELFWEDASKNRAHFGNLIDTIKEQTDLIVLPEMFNTGFTMQPDKLAEAWNGETMNWLKNKAIEKNCVITGSLAIKDNEKFYNRLFWVSAAGAFISYDKRHLFRMSEESKLYTAGKSKIITAINQWKVCPFICYDLRFPVWSRNRFNKQNNTWDYDVLVYVANWPEARNYAWKQLLIARAIENQCYVVAVNRIGNDGNGYSHSGDSVVINPRGEIISKTKANEQSIETIELDRAYLEEFRKVFPVGLDADDFSL